MIRVSLLKRKWQRSHNYFMRKSVSYLVTKVIFVLTDWHIWFVVIDFFLSYNFFCLENLIVMFLIFLLRHTPSMYPLSPGAGFRSPYPSALPGPSDFYRFSPTGLIQPHPGLSPHPPHLGSHPAIVTPGPKQELPDINNRYGDIYR